VRLRVSGCGAQPRSERPIHDESKDEQHFRQLRQSDGDHGYASESERHGHRLQQDDDEHLHQHHGELGMASRKADASDRAERDAMIAAHGYRCDGTVHNDSRGKERKGMVSLRNFVLGIALLGAAGALHAASATRTSSFAYESGTGLLIKEVVEPTSSTLCVVT